MVLGAIWDGSETGFAVFSSAAVYDGDVSLCLLDGRGGEERIPMTVENDIWIATVPGVGPGQRYGYRARGPWAPDRGLFFDDRRVLVDPYARAIELVAPRAAQSLVVDPWFDWGYDRRPDTPWSRTVLYETHVKGISWCHPGVDPLHRGTFLGLASPAVLDHLLAIRRLVKHVHTLRIACRSRCTCCCRCRSCGRSCRSGAAHVDDLHLLRRRDHLGDAFDFLAGRGRGG